MIEEDIKNYEKTYLDSITNAYNKNKLQSKKENFIKYENAAEFFNYINTQWVPIFKKKLLN